MVFLKLEDVKNVSSIEYLKSLSTPSENTCEFVDQIVCGQRASYFTLF